MSERVYGVKAEYKIFISFQFCFLNISDFNYFNEKKNYVENEKGREREKKQFVKNGKRLTRPVRNHTNEKDLEKLAVAGIIVSRRY